MLLYVALTVAVGAIVDNAADVKGDEDGEKVDARTERVDEVAIAGGELDVAVVVQAIAIAGVEVFAIGYKVGVVKEELDEFCDMCVKEDDEEEPGIAFLQSGQAKLSFLDFPFIL